jgi:putative endopeptidase
MKIQKILSAALVSSLFTLSSFAAPANVSRPAPSSAIPEKREFPLSKTELPCNDFHKYVCSEVESSFKLRDDRRSHTFAFNDSYERLLDIKKKFMAEIPTRKDLDPRTAQVRDTYLACMDKTNSALSEKKEVARTMAAMKNLNTPQEILQYSHKNMATDPGSFIGYGASANVDDSNKMDAWVGGSFMNLPDHSYYENPALMKDYETLLTHFYQIAYGKSLSLKDAKKKAQAIIGLQKDFIKVYPVVAVRRQRTSERRTMTQAEFIKAYPGIFPELLLKEAPKEAMIRLVIPETMEFLNQNLDKYPANVWKDFYIYENLAGYLDDAYPAYYKEAFNFRKKHYGGAKVRPVRQERCTNLVSEEFTMELDAALIEKVFPTFPEDLMQEVGQKIRASLIDGLKANTWLSKESKVGALKKIEKMRLQMVRPHTDREWDFTPVRTYSAKDRILNGQTYRQAGWEKTLKELSEPTNKDAWGMGPLTINAYYSPSENKFVLPMGILQFPFFSKDNSVIENLGAIGAVVGHEMGHSIDDNGANYDFEGNIKPWMSTKDLAELKVRTKGLVDQFNRAGHNGLFTLGENVGDLVGVTSAYNAAFPGGKGTLEDKQKFFTAYGRNWCSVYREGYDQHLLKTDPHSLGWARINEQVKLQPGFAEAFNCKAGDKMFLPESERVKVW